MERIVNDPTICAEQPSIRGTRVLVHVILDFLATGDSVEGILEDYPQIAREDVPECLAYAARLARGAVVVPPHADL